MFVRWSSPAGTADATVRHNVAADDVLPAANKPDVN